MFRIFMTLRSDYRLEKLALMDGGLKSYSQHGQVLRVSVLTSAPGDVWVGRSWQAALKKRERLVHVGAHESLLSVP